MIQRIQSVFLLASLCFLLPMFFVPTAKLIYQTGEILAFDFTGFSISDAGTTTRVSVQYSILAFFILICALNLLTIFMYKIRLLQIRLCIYNILLLLGITGVAIFVAYNVENVQTVSIRLPIVFPFISAILHYLALRAIRKDHYMVEALSRLR